MTVPFCYRLATTTPLVSVTVRFSLFSFHPNLPFLLPEQHKSMASDSPLPSPHLVSCLCSTNEAPLWPAPSLRFHTFPPCRYSLLFLQIMAAAWDKSLTVLIKQLLWEGCSPWDVTSFLETPCNKFMEQMREWVMRSNLLLLPVLQYYQFFNISFQWLHTKCYCLCLWCRISAGRAWALPAFCDIGSYLALFASTEVLLAVHVVMALILLSIEHR